jgi:hypothetical protein
VGGGTTGKRTSSDDSGARIPEIADPVGFVCVGVAERLGRSTEGRSAAPFHETLYEHYQLLEHKRLEALMRDAEGLQAAKRNAIAFHKPKDLEDERSELLADGVLPDPACSRARA